MAKYLIKMMNQLFIILVFFIKCCLQKFKVIAKYSAVPLAMTILLNGAINKSKIDYFGVCSSC